MSFRFVLNSIVNVPRRQLFTKMKSLDLRGVFPPIATSFDDHGNLAVDKYVENLKKWDKIGFRGLVILGTNGEFPYLSENEKLELARVAKQNMSPDKLLICGAGCEGTKMTIDLCEKFAEVGADAALVYTPCFFKSNMTDRALENHYRQVADASPIPVILYGVPSCTGIDFSHNLAVTLSHHPNIIGFKDSGGNIEKMAKIALDTKNNNFQVLAGSAHFLMDAILSGCVGGVCAVANLLGNETVELAKLCYEKKLDEAKILHQRIYEPNLAVTRKHGVPALKHMMDVFGYYGGPVRSPLQPLSTELKRAVEHEYVKSGFHPQN